MDKIAIHKEAMEKIAARAWKKFLPQLSNTNYNRLVDAGIYNKNKELQGLRRGTHNILKQNDIKMIKNPNRAGAASVEMSEAWHKQRNIPMPSDIRQDLRTAPQENMAFSQSFKDDFPNGGQPSIKSANNKTGGFTFVPKNEHNSMLRANPEISEYYPELQPLSRRDRDGRKWSQAITERHEADEIRFDNRNIEKRIAAKQRTGKRKYSNTGYMSHATPKVLMQESANVGMMPREVKTDVMTNMRKVTGEASDLQNRTGIGYGSSAVYDKKAARKAEKSVIRQRRDEGWNGYLE